MKKLCALLLFLLSGCASQSITEYKLGNLNYSNEPVGLYLIPVFGADSSIVADLEKRLQKQHGLRVVTTTYMGLDAQHFDIGHQQFIAEEIAKTANVVLSRLRNNLKTPAIVIIPGDMNSNEFRLRFLFSMHFFNDRTTVLSLARIDPRSYRQPANHDLVVDRATKLINKALGFHLYGYQASSDMGNVMYGPIMGLDDLDQVNMWYKNSNIGQ